MALEVDIEKRLGSFQLNVRFNAEDGVLSLLGASGCGKSTLLRIVSELQERDGGEIVFHDNTLKENLGFVFQDSVHPKKL